MRQRRAERQQNGRGSEQQRIARKTVAAVDDQVAQHDQRHDAGHLAPSHRRLLLRTAVATIG